MDEKLTIWTPNSRNQIKPLLLNREDFRAEYDAPGQEAEEKTERYSRRREYRRRGMDIGRFLSQNRDIVRNVIIMLIAVLIGCGITYWRTSKVLGERYAMDLKLAVFQAEQQLATKMRDEYGITEAEALQARMEEEARLCAKMLQPMNGNTVNGKRSACWSAFCRVDSPNYDNTLEEVLSQKSAYMGYSEDNQVTQENYDIAYKEVVRWHSGIRPMSYSMIYLLWTPKEIQIFDSMDGNAHYWYESDWDEFDEAHGSP